MPKKIGTTFVPRNPVARSPLLKKGGAHQTTKTTDRRNVRQAVKSQLEDWRGDLEFERSLKDESSFDGPMIRINSKRAFDTLTARLKMM